MTAKKAIKVLERQLCFYHPTFQVDIIDALKLAIEALNKTAKTNRR